MGRAPCCDKEGLKRGPWTPEEDDILVDFIKKHGHGSWRSLPKQAGLLRCGKSCRLRWTNYLRPDIKRGPFTEDEEKTIIQLHGIIGNRWASIAAQLPGRTDNEIKNFWNTHLKKRLVKMGLDPKTHSPASPFSALSTASASAAADPSSFPSTRHMAQWESARLEAEARLSRESMLFSFCNNEDYPQPSDPSDKPGVDVFLRIWNSEIGESFRSKKGAFVKVETEESPEPASPASSSSKHGSTVTATTTPNAPVFSTVGCEDFECKSSVSGGMMKMVIGGGSDSSCSNELEDSSETSLHLLLNFNGDDEMSGFFAEDVW